MANAQIAQIRTMLKETPLIPEGASLAEMRVGLDSMGGMFPRLDDVSSQAANVGDIDGEWFDVTGGDSDRVMLYLHGGGYLLGSVESHRAMIERITKATGGRVLAINYRLAPEHPFPAAVDDGVAAYRGLLSEGYQAGRISIAGDSAGGGLAIALLVALRDAGEPMPGCAVPISPWTDMECGGASIESRASVDPMVQKEILMEMGGAYLSSADPKSPLASPLNADFNGLPPMLIQVGDAEVLLDDSTRLEAKMKAAGVDVTVEVWDEMIHVWHLFAPILDKGQEAIDRLGAYVKEKTA